MHGSRWRGLETGCGQGNRDMSADGKPVGKAAGPTASTRYRASPRLYTNYVIILCSNWMRTTMQRANSVMARGLMVT
jgi:hypothetical protein